MIEENRWTIRNVTKDARAMIDEVHDLTGIPYGRLVTYAIEAWYDELPEENPYQAFRKQFDDNQSKFIAEQFSAS